MTIYVCQELEQSRVPVQQKREGGGDSSLCGESGPCVTLRDSGPCCTPVRGVCVLGSHR